MFDFALIAGLVVTLFLAVFFALAEASLLRTSRYRALGLAGDNDTKASKLEGLLDRLPEVLNLILLMALLSQVGAATLTGTLAGRWTGNLGVTIASAVLTLVLFIYAEAIPKTYAVRHPERVALAVAGPIAALDRVLSRVVSALVWFADIQMPGKGITTSPSVTEDELRLLAGEAAREGEITGDDYVLIERAFRFGDRRVDDIMVPRPDIVAIPAQSRVADALETALGWGHRRLLVYSESREHIDGIVAIRDLMVADRNGVESLDEVIQPPFVVPKSLAVTRLLAEMQRQNEHLAIVIDEHGATAGLVTIEDIAAEILGTITYDQPTNRLERDGPTSWSAPGSLPVEDLSAIGMQPPDGEWNTLAGLLLGVAGKVLSRGDTVLIGPYLFTVKSVFRRRIRRVAISRVQE